MYVKNPAKSVQDINFLKSEKFTSFTYQADSSTEGVANGVLPAGSLYPKNDATAIGVTINDVDVTNGSQAVGVIVEGHILYDRLPVTPSDAALKALSHIAFYDENGFPKKAIEAPGE